MTQTLARGIKDKEVNTYFLIGRHSVYIYCCVLFSLYKYIITAASRRQRGCQYG